MFLFLKVTPKAMVVNSHSPLEAYPLQFNSIQFSSETYGCLTVDTEYKLLKYSDNS